MKKTTKPEAGLTVLCRRFRTSENIFVFPVDRKAVC